MNTPLATHLYIEGLRVELSLGVTEEERKKPQQIEIDVQLFFPKTPLACLSDEPRDALPYAKCIDLIQAAAHKKPFQLLEHLVYEIHSSLKKELPIYLEILVKGRNNGMSFTYFPKKEEEPKKTARVWNEE